MNAKPYLSIVLCARNDNYGGSFTRRMQVFLNVLLAWADRYRLDAELLVVEWNPPADQPPLHETLTWASSGARVVEVRFVQVPPAIHARFPNADRMPMFEYLAKNAGIRRAAGAFILVTNPDLIYTKELIAFLAAGRLSSDNYYRIDRYDFHGPPPLTPRPAKAVRFAKHRVFAVHFREDRVRGGTMPMSRFQRHLAAWTGSWPSSRRATDAKPLDAPAISLNDDTGCYGGIHTNAAGDFILAHRTCWHRIRGFPEFTDTFSHLDGYACYQLKAMGLGQVVLLPPAMILHADHSREGQKKRPSPVAERWRSDLQAIQTGRIGPALNAEDWGLAAEALPEFSVRSVARTVA